MPVTYADPELKNYVEIKKTERAAHRLQYHLVMCTKYRKPILENRIYATLTKIIKQVFDKNKYYLLTLSVALDHIHCAFNLKPEHAPANVPSKIKQLTTYYLLREFPDLEQIVGQRKIWADGYFIRTIGDVNIAQIKAYLDRQDEHHKLI